MHDTDADDRSALPPVDARAPERRRLPVVEFSSGYGFDGPNRSVDLLGLFAGRRQLVVDHSYWWRLHDEYPSDDRTAAAA